MMLVMRTTVNLPEDVHEAARALAELRRVSLGEALAELARRGLRSSAAISGEKPFPCFQTPPDAKPITLEQTLLAEDEL